VSDFIACIARVTLSARGSDSRLGGCDIVRSGRKRCGLGEVRHFSSVRHSVVGYVSNNLIMSYEIDWYF
jgi:hypothetical protein